ncbi:hypothetical protein ACFVOK_36170 [Streptomyces sp. NPDC057798]|uniref:hypothetical protein n=1 Tax=Streptomyces sp. NPDC057798 TaxID=3346252 RepID=UPI0036A91245
MHAAVGTGERRAVAEGLAFGLGGAVIHHGHVTSPYYALIQWHAGMVWDGAEDTPCLATNTHYPGVPHWSRQQPPGPCWVVPPRYEGDVCRPQRVRLFIARARQQLAPLADG